MRPNVTWQDLGDWYNTLIHGNMYLHEGQKGNASSAIEDVIDKIEKFRNEKGETESFRSLSDRWDKPAAVDNDFDRGWNARCLGMHYVPFFSKEWEDGYMAANNSDPADRILRGYGENKFYGPAGPNYDRIDKFF